MNKKQSFLCFLFATLLLLSACSSASQIEASKQKNVNIVKFEPKDFIIVEPYIADGLIKAKSTEDEKYGLMDTKGNLKTNLIYKSIKTSNQGYTLVTDDNDKFAYIDENGDIIFEQYDNKFLRYGDIFKDGFASVYLDDIKGSFVIDNMGYVLLEPTEKNYIYYNIGHGYFNRIVSGDVKDMAHGVVNVKGDVLTDEKIVLMPYQESQYSFYSNGYSDEYGIFDWQQFTKVNEKKFIPITFFNRNNRALVSDLERNYLIIDGTGQIIKKLDFEQNIIDIENINNFYETITAINFTNNQPAILMDDEGNITKTTFDTIFEFNDNVALADKDGKYGYVDTKGNELIAPEYDEASNVYKNVCFVKKDEHWYRCEFK